MKKVIMIFLSLLLLTGCTFVNLSDKKVDDIIDEVLTKNVQLYNNVFEGYKFYAPRGLKVIDKNKYNCKILSEDNVLYLYVDVVSYYYKVKNKFSTNDKKVLSKEIDYDGKSGYIEITEVNNKYFVEFMYNYSKIETYIEKKYLNDAVLNMTYILSSMSYNDKVIETLIDEDTLDYKEEKFNIFESKTENSSFLQALEKYDNYVETDPEDQDILEFEEVE